MFLLPVELQKEIGAYIHRKYYQVVLEELDLMTLEKDFEYCDSYKMIGRIYITPVFCRHRFFVDSIYLTVSYIRWSINHSISITPGPIRNINMEKKTVTEKFL